MEYEDEKPRELRGMSFDHIAFDEITNRKAPKGIHSELHELIFKMRAEFGEKAGKGVGSFSYYLGMLKKVPISTIYQWLGSIRQSTNLNTPTARAKVFWWYYSKWRKK